MDLQRMPRRVFTETIAGNETRTSKDLMAEHHTEEWQQATWCRELENSRQRQIVLRTNMKRGQSLIGLLYHWKEKKSFKRKGKKSIVPTDINLENFD
ncbi:hypothetical protein Trydic_g12141 [Trypoxylus dichotomus]